MLSPTGLAIMFVLGYFLGRLITQLQTDRKTNKLNQEVMQNYKDLGVHID